MFMRALPIAAMVGRALMDRQEFASSDSSWNFLSHRPGIVLSASVSGALAEEGPRKPAKWRKDHLKS